MLDKKMSRTEIEEILKSKGDFVQIDYLTRYLEQRPPLAMKRLAYSYLSRIYEKKGMYLDAGKSYENLAEASIAFSDKKANFIKATELYIRAGNFDHADYAMKKAMAEATASEKAEIVFTVKELYKKQAKEFEHGMKRSNAVKVYEKLIGMKLSDSEMKEMKEKLIKLYESLGKFKEINMLKNL